MTTTIALAGKGGVGKTTVAAMVIRYLAKNQPEAILAVDADPSSNLNMVLGLELDSTIGDIREGMLDEVQKSLVQTGAAMGSLPGGITKQEYLDYEVRPSVIEGDRYDLIAMGRSEGPGCYCAVNHNLRNVLDTISRHYRWVVIDNEAGLEHLSRRTTRDVQHLLVVSDPTLRGLMAADRIAQLRHELNINVENAYLILNRLSGPVPPALQARIDEIDLPLLGIMPEDSGMFELEISGQSLVELPDESPIYQAVANMLAQIL